MELLEGKVLPGLAALTEKYGDESEIFDFVDCHFLISR